MAATFTASATATVRLRETQDAMQFRREKARARDLRTPFFPLLSPLLPDALRLSRLFFRACLSDRLTCSLLLTLWLCLRKHLFLILILRYTSK